MKFWMLRKMRKKKQKEELRNLQNEELPMLMQEIGIKKFELEDGSSVNVKEI